MPERDAAIQRLLTANAQWAQDVTRLEPNFFEQSAKGQSPHVRCLSIDYQRRPTLTLHVDSLDRMRRF